MKAQDAALSRTTCPTCGTPVELMQADEGTCSYRPAIDAQPLAEFVGWLVAADDLPTIRASMTLTKIMEGARYALAQYEGADRG